VCETHQEISSPRSDSGYLPGDPFAEACDVFAGLRKSFHAEADQYLFEGIQITQKSRAWNDGKVTAHHGIIPTMQAVRVDALDEAEGNVYRVVVERYLMQFLPDHEYEAVKLELEANGTSLEATGRKTVIAGWKSLEMADSDRVDPPIPYLNKGDRVAIEQAKVTDRQTKPPARYTEGTLIRGMTRLASEVDDPDMRAIPREHDGLGTEATRAEIIQTLKNRGFIEVRRKSLCSTSRGRELIAAIPKQLKDPSTTAVMERMLGEVEAGKLSLAQFMARQQELVAGWIGDAREALLSGQAQGNEAGIGPSEQPSGQDLGNCPECGSPLAGRRGKFGSFVGCSRYPECRYIRRGKNGTGKRSTGPAGKTCVRCGSPMVMRRSRRGPFLGCSAYPKCRHTMPMQG